MPLHNIIIKSKETSNSKKIPLTPPGCVLASLSDLIFHRLTHLCSQTNYCNIIKKEKSNNFFNDLNQPGPQLLNIFCIHQKLLYVTRPVVIELSLDRCPYIVEILYQSEPGSIWNFDMVLFFKANSRYTTAVDLNKCLQPIKFLISNFTHTLLYLSYHLI